ncbi:T9SS type A sorting domain-containing protein [Hymenobacter terrenus]|uniref:T9SS type A sorting domain-containing protein n=1 Tax=Hymenobacter terrenus TaxID=1629124 RepID=UPI0006194DDD|nr:T9SS type A sorting domain-containing protein [Hymenobacter terrenus]
MKQSLRHPSALLALLLLGGAAAPRAGQAQTLYNGPGGILAVTDSVLYVRGDAAGKAFQNAGEFNQTATSPARPRLFLDEGDLLNTGTWVQGLGTVVFNGVSGTARNLTLNNAVLHKLRINHPGNVVLGSNGQVDNRVQLATGHLLTTTGFSLTLGAAATVVGEKNSSYVKGSLVQQKAVFGASNVDFGGMGFQVNPLGQSFTLQVDRRSGLNLVNYSYGQNPTVASFKGIDRIWRLTTSAPATVDLTLSWLTDNEVNNGLVFSGSNAWVWRSIDNGATWQRQGPGPQAAQTVGDTRTVTVNTTLVNGAWYTVSTAESPLPVELTAFTATARELDAVLKWNTASERNSAWFAIERSLNGTDWQEISRKAAAGNSSAPLAYSATDLGAGRRAAACYYRLHQIDLDGTSNYSSVQYVRFAKTIEFLVEAYPVPMQQYLTLDLVSPDAGPLQIELYDMTGRLIISQREAAPAGSSRYQVDVRTLATGNYTLRAVQGSRQVTRKVLHL